MPIFSRLSVLRQNSRIRHPLRFTPLSAIGSCWSRISPPRSQRLPLVTILLLLSLAAPVLAADDEVFSSLGLSGEEPFAATSHFPRPLSKIAENVTVITAADIERLNAHTLADVLQTVPGIQLDYERTPSSFTFFNIQGALNTTVLVLIDGVRQNDFNQNMAEPGLIPVQQIERIEIVKGAASAAWGPALGGVVNIITKSPDPEREGAGLLSGSVGEKATADTRGELHGTVDRLGYYLTAGKLYSRGLLPNNGTNLNQVYGKLSWLLPGRGTVTAGGSYLDARRGMDEGLFQQTFPVHDDANNQRINGFLKFNQPLATRLTLDVDGFLTTRDDRTELNDLVEGAIVPFTHGQLLESSRGLSARITWGDSRRNLVAGAEYGHDESKSQQSVPAPLLFHDRAWDRWALYANGAYTLGPLTILPGVRFDHTGLLIDNTSFTLGAVWQVTDKTLLRAYGARGYGLPSPRFQHGLMTITTLQAGIESEEVPLLWLKGTYFHNRLRDIESVGSVTLTNQNRQGFELELRTVPLFGFSLASGYTYTYVKDTDTGERLQTNSNQTVPPHLLKLGVYYNNTDLGLRGTLTGNYVDWNAADESFARSRGLVWDLHLVWKVMPLAELSPELFFSARNLFDNVQTTSVDLFKNTPRWVEGGVRFRF